MKKIVLTTTAVLSLVATGATISSVNAASVPMVKVWSPAANAYVEVPAIGYRDTDLVATDVTLVEKRKAQLGAFSKGNSEFITVDYVDKAYRQEFSKQFASFESNGIATFNGKTIAFKATDYGIYTMKFELDGVRYKLTADVRENVGKGAPFYTYVTKLEVLSTNQANAISNTSTEKQIEATITKVEIHHFGVNFEQFPAGTYILEMSGEAGSPHDHSVDNRKRVFKVRKEVTIGNPSTNSNTNTTTQSDSNSNFSGSWVQSGSRWWYKHEDGTYTANGWEKINGVWYRFDNSGWMQTGWVKDGGWYYLDGSGAMKTGWLKDNGNWYYLQDSGAMKTGWMKVSGKWYYAYSSGALAINTTTPDGYRVNANGEWV